MPKVSVIIPVYNVEPYLRESLDSVVNQTLKDIEIICVDDCSTDGCLSILEEYAAKDDRFRLIKLEKNGGLGKARNCGFEYATGDYIMFLDSDDWLESFACETAYDKIFANKDDFAIFNYTNCFPNGMREISTGRTNPFKDVFPKDNIVLANMKNPKTLISCFAWAGIYNTEFLRKHKILCAELRCAEDHLFTAQVWAYAGTMSVIEEPLYCYRKREGSLTFDEKYYMQRFDGRKLAYDAVCLAQNDKILNTYIIYYVNSIIYWHNEIPFRQQKLRHAYYDRMRKIFISLSKNHDMGIILPYISGRYRKICSNNYFIYNIICWIESKLQKILSVKNAGKYKQLTVLGVKMKFRRNLQNAKG